MTSAMVNVVPLVDVAASATAYRFDGRDHGSSLSFFVTQHPTGTGPPLHRHPYDETFLVQEGSGTFTVEGETVEVGAGNIVVVRAGAAHRFVNSGDGVLRQVTMHPHGHVVHRLVGQPRGAVR